MNIAIALVPVVLLLALLQLMDSFKLVRLSGVLGAIGTGASGAVLCLALHDWLMGATGMDVAPFARYVSPVTEELVKAAFIVLLLRQRRIGFLVDAAVLGFGVGAGFALVENVDYLWSLGGAPVTLWLVRGLGTAVLHGATTAMFGIVAKTLFDRWPTRHGAAMVPGLVLAIAIHSGFNHLPLPPLAMTALLLLVLPLLLIWIFQRSEQATREWVGAGLDLDIELLDLVRSEHFALTRFGTYLERAEGPVPRARRRRHVLPAAAGARTVHPGQGDAPRAGGRAGAACDARPPRQPGGVAVPPVVDRTHGPPGAQTPAGDVGSRPVARVPAGNGGEAGQPLTERVGRAATCCDRCAL